MLLIDGHEDIAWNALTFGREYGQSVHENRAIELTTEIPGYVGTSLLGLKEWIEGEVGVIFATIFMSPRTAKTEKWDKFSYIDNKQAHSFAIEQMDFYWQLCDRHENLNILLTSNDLEETLHSWNSGKGRIGLVLLMEGADPIIEPENVIDFYQRGLRIIGPAWAETKYSGSAYDSGPLKKEGHKLLGAMQEVGMILDLSHLSEKAFYECLDLFDGTVIASHANPRKFLKSERGLSDHQIEALAERDGTIGIVPYNRFLLPGWAKGDDRTLVSLDLVADAIDHICQLTGHATNVAFGTDFDGGFGRESVPSEIETIADMQKIIGVLEKRGYGQEAIRAIFHENWLRVLRAALTY